MKVNTRVIYKGGKKYYLNDDGYYEQLTDDMYAFEYAEKMREIKEVVQQTVVILGLVALAVLKYSHVI